jgi:hypothetical protein
MKKLLAIISCGATLYCSGATYPNITTNQLNTAQQLELFFYTNTTFLSNLTFILQQNLTTNNNVWTGSNYFTQIYLGGNIRIATNTWAGPTNTLDLSYASQDYVTYTPMSITGLVNKVTGYVSGVSLNITNAASTNVNLYLPASITTDDGGRQYVVTNGTLRTFSLRQSPNYTNNVTRTMF